MWKSYLNLIVLSASFLALILLKIPSQNNLDFFLALSLQIYILFSSVLHISPSKPQFSQSHGWPYILFSLVSLAILFFGWKEGDAQKLTVVIEMLILSGLLLLANNTVIGFLKSGVPSFVSTNRMYRLQLIVSVIISALSQAILYHDQKAWDWSFLGVLQLCFAFASLTLVPGWLFFVERRIIKHLPITNFTPYVDGSNVEVTTPVLLEKIQSNRTIAFAKKEVLTDGKIVFQEVDHRATMLETTVLSTFVALFKVLDSTVANTITEKLGDNLVNITFDSIQVTDGAVSASDEFGVNYQLGTYAIAKDFTQDDSYTYYLTRGYTLFAKLRFSDSVISAQLANIEAFNHKPMNTVCLTSENAASCTALLSDLHIDKAYSDLNKVQQIELLKQLIGKAPTAYVGFNESLCKTATLGFHIKGEDSVQALEDINSWFLAAKVIRNTYRTFYYWMFTLVVVGTPFAIVLKLPLLTLIGGVIIGNLFASLVYWGVITYKLKK